MSKDEFTAKYGDELTGLLLAAFNNVDLGKHKLSEESFAKDGRFVINQMKRARDLLGRMFDDAVAKPKLASATTDAKATKSA